MAKLVSVQILVVLHRRRVPERAESAVPLCDLVVGFAIELTDHAASWQG